MRSDADLLRSFDAEAFGEFYERHVSPVTAYVARRTRRPDLVFDFVAETFARALEHRHGYEPRKGPAIAWLLGIAHHLLTDADRRGAVADAARVRLKLEPIALDDEQLAQVSERSRLDLIEALGTLPESQRIVVVRRVLGEQEYSMLGERVVRSEQVVRGLPARREKHREPFDVLGERLFLAAGGRLATGRRRPLAIAAVCLALFGAGMAAAAMTLPDDSDPANPLAPGATRTPTPSPTATAPPVVIVPPIQTPRPNRRPREARPGPGGTTGPTPAPTPTVPPQYDIDFQPDFKAGEAGWCVSITIRTPQLLTGGRGCTRAGPPGTNLIAAGGVFGSPGAMYAVVDRAVRQVRISDRRRIEPRRDPAIPAGWRVAIWDINTPPGGQPPTFTLHDAAGRDVSATPATAPPGARLTKRVNARRPPKERCAITARSGAGLRPVTARLLVNFRPLDLVRPSYLSCADTTFRMSGRRFRAAVLLNSRDLQALAPPLPSTGRLAVRRAGTGWLVVSGGNATQRKRILNALSVRRP